MSVKDTAACDPHQPNTDKFQHPQTGIRLCKTPESGLGGAANCGGLDQDRHAGDSDTHRHDNHRGEGVADVPEANR